MSIQKSARKKEALSGKFSLVPVERIEIPDYTGVFSYPRDDDSISESVSGYGIISPLLLLKKSGVYYVICGVKRFISAQKANMNFVPAVVTEGTGLSEKDFFDTAYSDNVSFRKFNVVEAGGIISVLMDRFNVNPGEILSRYHHILDFRSGREGLETLKKVYRLEKNIRDYIISRGIAVSLFSRLLDFDEESRKILFKEIDCLQLNGGKLKQFLEYIFEICRRENTTAEKITGDDMFSNIIENEKTTVSQKQTKIQEFLTRRRYPELTKRAGKFFEISSGIEKINAGTFTPPLNFEGDRLSAEIKFKYLDEIDRFCEAVKIESNREKIRSLLDML